MKGVIHFTEQQADKRTQKTGNKNILKTNKDRKVAMTLTILKVILTIMLLLRSQVHRIKLRAVTATILLKP